MRQLSAPPSRPPVAPAAPPAPTVASNTRPASAPIIRAQRPEEPAPEPPAPRPPERLTLPSPEQLGVACNRSAGGSLDWAAVNRRIENLGATCFQINKLSANRWRVLCLLPTAQGQTTHRIEAEADSNSEAVRLALERAEQWCGQQR